MTHDYRTDCDQYSIESTLSLSSHPTIPPESHPISLTNNAPWWPIPNPLHPSPLNPNPPPTTPLPLPHPTPPTAYGSSLPQPRPSAALSRANCSRTAISCSRAMTPSPWGRRTRNGPTSWRCWARRRRRGGGGRGSGCWVWGWWVGEWCVFLL